MDKVLNEQENSSYATPFNVDFFGSKPKNFFAEYTMRVLSLPESIKNILMDSSTAEFIEDGLGPNFNLNRIQITEITRIIRDILLGDLSLNDTTSTISQNLKVSPTVANQIQNKIMNDLFGPAVEDIKKIQKEKPPQSQYIPRPAPSRPPVAPERPDLKIEPDINRNNIVDLRNKQ